MIDPKLLRASTDDVASNLARRGFSFDAAAYLALEERRKALQVETESLQSERNTRSKSIGKAKAAGEDIQPLGGKLKNHRLCVADCNIDSDFSLSAVQYSFGLDEAQFACRRLSLCLEIFLWLKPSFLSL